MSTQPAREKRAGHVALVGRSNVGKSTLLNALVGEPVAITSARPQTTREPVRGILTTKNTQYVLVDTPGLHEPRTRLGRWMNDVARRTAHGADVVVLVIEAPKAGKRVDERDLALSGQFPAASTVIAINKVDRLADKSQLLPLIASLTERHAFAATIPLSASRGEGLDRLLEELRKLLPARPFILKPDALSDQPVRFFVAEFIREQLLEHIDQEVPHGAAVVVETFDEAPNVPRIDVTVHVAREAHKKIVIGAGGRMLKRIGTAARARVERMLDRRVHLQLWVRVTPDWMDDDARLRELGYRL